MPAIVCRIEQLFPDLKLEGVEDNILLQTIRVPKKLLSLTDRLPKPNYEIKEDNRHTTIASYLPKIEKSKRHYSYKQSYKKLFGRYAKLIPINLAKVSPTLKNPIVLEKIPSREHVDPINKPLEEYIHDFEIPGSKIPKRKSKKLQRQVNKLKNEDIIKLLHDKYVKKNPIAKQSIELIPYLSKNIIEPIGKKNYIVKP
jgi:hypothetical protein